MGKGSGQRSGGPALQSMYTECRGLDYRVCVFLAGGVLGGVATGLTFWLGKGCIHLHDAGVLSGDVGNGVASEITANFADTERDKRRRDRTLCVSVGGISS